MLLELINGERVFITKADKGGATLIINYDTVVNTILQEIEDPCKYIKLEEPVEKRMEATREVIVREVLKQVDEGNISDQDKTLITGLNENNNKKHDPEYIAVPPRIWPLFKVHKVSWNRAVHKIVI